METSKKKGSGRMGN